MPKAKKATPKATPATAMNNSFDKTFEILLILYPIPHTNFIFVCGILYTL